MLLAFFCEYLISTAYLDVAETWMRDREPFKTWNTEYQFVHHHHWKNKSINTQSTVFPAPQKKNFFEFRLYKPHVGNSLQFNSSSCST